MARLLDRTRQHRASLPPENAQKFHHGKGLVSGHPWTKIVLSIHDLLMPLQPLPCSSKRYGQDQALADHTAPALVVADINQCDVDESIGAHAPREVLVLAESGSEEKTIAPALLNTRWNGILAGGKTRRVPSATVSLTTPQSRPWCHMATFFRHHRRLKWPTVRVMTHRAQRQRRACRLRHTLGSLRSVGKMQWVCSAPSKRPAGRRQSFACMDTKATARQIVLGSRRRWTGELFHQEVQMSLSLEEVATSGGDAVLSHVHWVYGAYLWLHMSPPGVPTEVKSIGDKQRKLQTCLEHKEKRCILQKLTQIGGVQRYKDELRQALTGT